VNNIKPLEMFPHRSWETGPGFRFSATSQPQPGGRSCRH